MFPPRPTELLHHLLRAEIAKGDFVIDATAGNGHDTVFLAEAVGPNGRVLALDIQEQAIESTRSRLEGAGLGERVRLHLASHTELAELAAGRKPGAVIFNLGYLPGGDHGLITHAKDTLLALSAANGILRPGGVLAVVCYPGHEGGEAEAREVELFFSRLTGHRTAKYGMLGTERPAPFLLVSRKPDLAAGHFQLAPTPLRG